MTNEELVVRIKNGIDEAENMLALWQQNRMFIGKIAQKYSAYEDVEDLRQEGYLGLCSAVEAYSPDGGASFLGYATFWIKQAMQSYIDNCGSCVRIPADTRQKLRRFKKFESAFYQYYGRKPADKEIYLHFGNDCKDIVRMQKNLRMDSVESLDKPLPDSEEDTREDFIPADVDIEQEVLDRIEQEELKQIIWPLVDALPGRQPEILRAQFIDNMNLKQISETAGESYEYTRAQRNSALRKLRHPANSEKLYPFLSERALSMAYCGSAASFNRTWTSATERAALFEVEGK